MTEAVYAHHERWDGTGYPLGLRASRFRLFPELLRLPSVSTAGPSLTDILTRPKKSAIKIIMLQSGHRFDPHIAEIVYNMVNEDIAQKGSKNGSGNGAHIKPEHDRPGGHVTVSERE